MRSFTTTSFRRMFVRLMKQKETPESIARGTAVGLLIGFVVPFSLQMVIAFQLSLLCKASKVPALLFTWISNPLTIPFIYPLQCYIGSRLIGRPLSLEALHASSANLIETPTLGKLLEFGAEMAASFVTGGLLLGSLAGLFGYVISVRIVREYQKRKQRRRSNPAPFLHNKGNLI